MIDHGLVRAVHNKFQTSMTEHYRSHLDGTNINKTSMLTTDYLNHFSGVLMLMEMLPSDPEGLAGEVLEWSPLSYTEHFEVTGFRDKELAVKAYEHAPFDVRKAFDKVIKELNETMVDTLRSIEQAMERGESSALSETCQTATPLVRELIDQAADIVNRGASNVVEISSVVDPAPREVAQDEIDALFD